MIAVTAPPADGGAWAGAPLSPASSVIITMESPMRTSAWFTGPGGEVIHAQVRIGDSIVMITEEAGDNGGPAQAPPSAGGAVTAIMATYWPDVDQAWERAVAAGAEVIFPLADQFYGERGGRLRDPFGQQWMLSQRIEHVSSEEMARRAAELFGSPG